MNSIKPATVLALYRVPMHMIWFSDWIQYGRQACVKVSPQMVNMQIWRPVDKGFGMYLLVEFDQPSTVLAHCGVSMHVK